MSSLTTEGKVVFGFVSIIVLSALFLIGYQAYSTTQKQTIDAKVIDIQQQQKISGSNNSVSTKMRYLVITDKETFVVKNSVLNWKFNSSDIFYRLEKCK